MVPPALQIKKTVTIMGDDAAAHTVAQAFATLNLTYHFHVCAEEIGNGATVDSADWKDEPSSGALAEIAPGTRRFLVRLRCDLVGPDYILPY